MAPVWAREESPTALLEVPEAAGAASEPVAVACEPVLRAPVLELPAPWEPVTVSVVQPAAGTVRLVVVPVVLPEPVVSVDEVVAAVVQSWPSSVEVAGAVDSEPAGVVGCSAAGLAGADGLADSEGWSAGVVAQSVAPGVGTMTVVPCRCVVGVGTVEQSLVGSVVAGVEGSVLGSVVAGVEGSVEGSVDGSVEGWSSGMTEPLPGVAGVVVGVLGSVEGSVVAGVLGSVLAGVLGSVLGSADGSVEGWSSGMTEPLPGVVCCTAGVLGSVEGWSSGIIEPLPGTVTEVDWLVPELAESSSMLETLARAGAADTVRATAVTPAMLRERRTRLVRADMGSSQGLWGRGDDVESRRAETRERYE